MCNTTIIQAWQLRCYRYPRMQRSIGAQRGNDFSVAGAKIERLFDSGSKNW